MGEQKSGINFPKNYFYLKGKNAEKIVHDLASKTFITDWCYLNPMLPSGKELCDLLVAFDDIAIIWQIKDLKLDQHGRYRETEVKRNLRQLSGARRQLFDLKTPIELENPRRGKEQFDATAIKEIYLISVLLGEGEELFSFIEYVKDYAVHVFNRDFTQIVLDELDTISDFVNYLRAKEDLVGTKRKIVLMGGEQELLAFYLMNSRNFACLNKATDIIIDQGSWQNLQNNQQYKAKKERDRISYGWDGMINRAHEGSLLEYEIIARELARPNRFQRRYLSKVYFDAAVQAHNDNKYDLFRRMLPADDVTYCFLFQDDPEPRERRKAMLQAMCLIARGMHQKNRRVLGIATEKKIRPECSYDFCLLNIPGWTEEHQKNMERLQQETGIFSNPIMGYTEEVEYPELQNN